MSNNKVLVVDDDIKIVQLVESILGANNFDVTKVCDGKTAITTAQDLKPGVIIMDIMLPDISGPDAVKALSGDASTANIPVIFLSGIADKEEGESASTVNVGGKFYPSIAKPFSPDTLLSQVRNIVQ